MIMRGLYNIPLGAVFPAPISFKQNPFAAAALMAIGSAAMGATQSAMNNHAAANLNADNRDFQREMWEKQSAYNTQEAQISREHQQALLTQEQNWQEQMYNLYNSPSAMMRQYQEAGMNPYLVDASHGFGSSMNSPSAPGSAQASAPSVGTPQTYMPDYSPLGNAFTQAANLYLSNKQVSANVANQSAKTLSEGADAYSKLRGHGMNHDDAMKLVMPFFKGTQGFDANSDRFFGMLDMEFKAKELSNQRDSLQLELDRYYSPKERQAKLNEVDQLITESVTRIGMMASEAKVNEAKCQQIAQDIKESLSRIFKNVAEGSLADVKGLEIMTILPYVETGMSLDMDKKELLNEETYGNETLRKMNKTTVGRAFNVVLHYLNRIFDSGNVGVNVSGKLNK